MEPPRHRRAGQGQPGSDVPQKILTDNCPGIRTGGAFTVWATQEPAAHTEIFAVIENSYEELRDRMAETLKEGDTFWLYTSNIPMKENYLNRTIDQPVWMMEMLGWLCYKRGATGYLHWGMNQWNTWTVNYEPFPDYPADEMWDNTLGDGSCVYPDVSRRSVRSSIRVGALREASKLNSLLALAAYVLVVGIGLITGDSGREAIISPSPTGGWAATFLTTRSSPIRRRKGRPGTPSPTPRSTSAPIT